MDKFSSQYKDLIQHIRNEPAAAKIKEVNDFFGTFLFVSDADHFNQKDFWQTPVELLQCGAGDCEDFAIAKYFALIEAGIDREQLRIGYVQATGFGLSNAAHMILLYYPDKGTDPLVLDNLIEDIKPLSARKDLTLVYSFNNSGIWIKDPTKKTRDNNLPTWVNLLSRMKG